jgi:hypothetical protein
LQQRKAQQVKSLYTQEAARRVAERAAKHGVQKVPKAIATYIALACAKEKLRYALSFAMFEQESNFKAIYGNDQGGLFPGQPVTQENYKAFRKTVVRGEGHGANGVGLGQVTYWTYIRDHTDLWKPKAQVYLATSILADYVHRLGEEIGVGAYNGGEKNPNKAYSKQVLKRAEVWRPLLAKD